MEKARPMLRATRAYLLRFGTAVLTRFRRIDVGWFTFTRLILVLSTAIGASYLYTELHTSRVVLEIAGVPKQFQDAGIPATVLAAHLNDELSILINASSEEIPGQFVVREANNIIESRNQPTSPASDKSQNHVIPQSPASYIVQQKALGNINVFDDDKSNLNPAHSLEIPATNISLQAVVDWLRDLGLGKPIPRVQIDIISDVDSYRLTVRILRGLHNNGERIMFFQSLKDIHPINLQPAAEFILSNLDPLTYVSYLYSTGRPEEARRLLQEELAEATDRDLARAYNLDGIRLYDDGRYDEARQQFAAATYPHYLSPKINEANAWHYQGYFEKAIVALKEVISAQPTNAMAHSNLGSIYMDQGRYGEALKEFLTAVRLEKDPRNYTNLGVSEWKLGRHEAATSDWMAALHVAPGYYYADEAWAGALFESGDSKGAELKIQEGINLSDAPDLYLWWAEFLSTHKDSDRGIQALRNGLKKFPNDTRLLVSLGDYLRRAKRCSEALTVYNELSRISSMASAGVVGTALCMADGGSITEAKSMLEKLVSDVDSPVEVYTALAVILQENGEDAVPIVHQGIAKYRYNGALENLLGVCLENKGDFAGAEEAYSAATKLLPRSAIVHVNLGDTFREQVQKGSAGSALKEYMIALGIDPTSVDAHIGMGIVYRSDGKIELAEDHYRKALSIDHNSQYAWRYLADLHQDQGRYAEAKDEYANAVKDGGENDPVILENYARCYQGLKDYKQADLLYGRAVARYQKRIGISQRLAPEYVQALFRWRDLLVQMGEDTTASEKGKMAEAIKLQYHLN